MKAVIQHSVIELVYDLYGSLQVSYFQKKKRKIEI